MSNKAEAIEFGDKLCLTEPANVAARLESSLKTNYGKRAIVAAGIEINYEHLDALTERFAHHIAACTDREALVPVLSKGGADYSVAILACIRAGRPFVPIDVQWPRDRVINVIERLDPVLLVAAGDISAVDAGQDLPSASRPLARSSG